MDDTTRVGHATGGPPASADAQAEPEWVDAEVDGRKLHLWPDPESGGVRIEIDDPQPVLLGRIEGLADHEGHQRGAELRLEEPYADWGLQFEDELFRAAIAAYNAAEREAEEWT